MTDFWKELDQGIKCIKLVEQLLKEKELLLDYLKERGSTTASVEFEIARMKYALGRIDKKPNYKQYFPAEKEITA